MNESTDELFQLFWQHPQNFKELVFVAQGGVCEFDSDAARDQWIRDMFEKATELRPEGWVRMVCTSKSEHFMWAVRS